MTDPLSRVRAGLDRDEAIARAASPEGLGWDVRNYDNEGIAAFPAVEDPEYGGEVTAETRHMERFDPSRVLRQSEKLREAAELLDSAVNGSGPEPDLLSVCAELAEILASIYPEDDTETETP